MFHGQRRSAGVAFASRDVEVERSTGVEALRDRVDKRLGEGHESFSMYTEGDNENCGLSNGVISRK